MVKLDEAYKFGAGRYLQGSGILEKAGKEILRFGKKAYIVGGPTALSLTRERLTTGFDELEYTFAEYGGQCSYEQAKAAAAEVKEHGYEIVVGVGGGRIMDLAKAIAFYSGCPVVNIPTTIATCAAYTPLSVMYTPDGEALGSLRYEYEVSAVLVDMDIIVHEPPRYVAAGILDAMAKLIELKNGHPEITLDHFNADLYTAYVLASYTYEALFSRCKTVCSDVAHHRLTKAVEDVTYINIAVTGMISGITKGFGQSAIGHEFYERTRTYFTREAHGYLHGEIVAVGLLAQLYYNQTPDLVPVFKDMMREIGMPVSLGDIHVPATKDTLDLYYGGIMESPYAASTQAESVRLREALQCLV